MIDRYQLRYFLAVVDHGNFSRAAANCHVSQPTLSAGIAKLERFLGTPLFLRSSQRVELTGAGTRFLDHARRIESEFNLALQAATAATNHPELRIGILHSIPAAFIARAVSQMRALDPEARIELVDGSERELVGHVARGRVDCALTLVARGGDRFLEETLFDEGYALALPANHRLAGEAVIEAEALAAEVMIVRRHCEALSETSRHFTERGVRPHFAYRSTNDERVLAMIAAGLGLTMMPLGYDSPGVVRPRLAGFNLRRSIGLIYGANAEALATTPPALIAALRTAVA
ncbi:LysR family transcriptional regulator [Sphingomonas sp. 37zxx]|uniref:LysR family transcriptional regulator n=1 Tax=Sphingomonas sp. 37zxx TaxID=1550073 RepID=UPI00053BE3A7|nr:LysR family transcriptional regulator [Sphingomonas sp. 37zxx]